MPTETGIFTSEEAENGHLFSYRLAKFIGDLLSEDKTANIHDFGCGKASYLDYLYDRGFYRLTGYEGTKDQEFEYNIIYNTDISEKMYSCDEKYKGHVICLEVGEHIPIERIDTFIDNLVSRTKKNSYLIISWAIPGQDGTGHINCQTNLWVIEKIKNQGFIFLEEESQKARDVIEPFYNYFKNTLIIFKKL